MGREGYPAEFRRRVLDLVAAGKSVREVARLLEVSDQSIYSWRRQELIDRGVLPGLSSEEREELRAARRADPRAGDRACRRSPGGGVVEGGGAPKRRFEAIAVMAGEGLSVEVCCRVLAVPCVGYYAWRFRPPSARGVRHAWLTDLIREIHTASYGAYGTNRVHAELVLGRGIRVGHCSVAMLMQRAGIQGRTGSPKRRGVPGLATADDLVDRVFRRDAPTQLWVTDVTEHPTREGKVYCAVVLDAFSRRVVGWSNEPQPDRGAYDQRARHGA